MNKLRQLFKRCRHCNRSTGNIKLYCLFEENSSKELIPLGNKAHLCKQCRKKATPPLSPTSTVHIMEIEDE